MPANTACTAATVSLGIDIFQIPVYVSRVSFGIRHANFIYLLHVIVHVRTVPVPFSRRRTES
jgi:hypothetical protein